MNRIFCDVCEKEIDEDRNAFYQFRLSGINLPKTYFLRLDICKNCKENFLENLTKGSQKFTGVMQK